MPIHLKVINPRQAEAGKIKIGGVGKEKDARSGGKYRQPLKHDHFIVTTTVRDDTGNFSPDKPLMDALSGTSGGAVRDIPILLDSDDLDEVFPCSLAAYQGKSLFCYGDGNSPATRYQFDNKGVRLPESEAKQHPCICELLGAKEGKARCLPHGTLWCTIVAGDETRVGARHAFRTTSWNSIRAIMSGLKTIQQIVGTIVGVPLWLCVRPRLVRPNGSDKSTTIHIVHVEFRTKDLIGMQRHVIAQARTRDQVAAIASRPVTLGMLPPGVGESELDQEMIAAEFHPDTSDEGEANDEDPGPSDSRVLDYDPDTGEILDQRDHASGEIESQEEDRSKPIAESHPVRVALKDLLTKVCLDRDFSDKDMKKGRSDVWNEACELAGYPRLPWKQLNLERAEAIGPKLEGMLRKED